MWAAGRGKTWMMDMFLSQCRRQQNAPALSSLYETGARRTQQLQGQQDPLQKVADIIQ